MKQLNLYYLGGGGDTPSIPDGRTVTPVNDVTIWQKCAGLTPTYTTLEQILADTGVLMALMVDENAVDYLVRSKEFAKREALVPTMTSDNTPSGVCIASTVLSGYNAYKAFDGDNTTAWIPNNNATNNYVGYEFASAQRVEKVTATIMRGNWGGSVPSRTFKVQGYSDDWHDIGTITTEATDTTSTDNYATTITTSGLYTKCRLFCEDIIHSDSQYDVRIIELQFYNIAEGICDNSTAMSYIGANDYAADTLLADSDWNTAIQNSAYFENVDNVKVPIMTSNTTPSGECFGSTKGSGYDYYMAFNDNSANYWYSEGATDQYVGYIFTTPKRVKKVRIIALYATIARLNNFKIQARNTGDNWVDIYSGQYPNTQDYVLEVSINPSSAYNEYRLYCIDTHGSENYIAIKELQFYGREKGGVQSLLRAAGITNKSYSTVAQLLLDSTSLQTIISSQAGVDYLAQCTAFAEAFASSSTAMTMIGNNNYASNTLLAVPEWAEAIANSTYFESVLNASTPLMTGPTSPSGEAFGYQNVDANRPPWKGFGNANGWEGNGGAGQYLGYTFPYDVKVVKARLYCDASSFKNAKIEAYNEDTLTWIELASGTLPNNNSYYEFVFGNSNVYSKYRILSLSTYQNNYSILYNLKFYGRKDI